MKNKMQIEPIRSLAFGSIGAAYAAVGTATSNATRIICFTNNTEGDMFFSRDGVNDELFVAAGNFKLFDLATNHRNINQDDCPFAANTQWYVKQSTAPVSGSVYIEVLYAT